METKTVYAYASDGKYLGKRTLDDTDRSPISGAWQIPGNMTEDKPPAAKEGYDTYWRGGKWEQIEHPKPTPEPTPQEIQSHMSRTSTLIDLPFTRLLRRRNLALQNWKRN